MTTTLTNIKIVGSPDYYLMAGPENDYGYARITSSILKTYNFRNTQTSCKFKLTKGGSSTNYNSLIRIDAISSLDFEFTEGQLAFVYGEDKYRFPYAFELNKWYVLKIRYLPSTLYVEICDENGAELATYSVGVDDLDKNMEDVIFYVGDEYGFLISRDSKVATNSEDAEVLADLSDLAWEVISSTGSTNAKFTAASEPVLESLSVTPSTSAQTLTPSSGVDGFNQVNVSAVENVLASNIKSGVSILGVTGTVVERNAQSKTSPIAASASLPVEFSPDSGYNCLAGLQITSIENLEASNIKQGVTIAGVTGSLAEKRLNTRYANIASYNSLPFTIDPDSNYDGMTSTVINSIGNLSASNVKSGVTIAGITGTLNEFRPTQKDLTIAADASLPTTYYPEGSANGFSSFTVSGITNLSAANIKKDVQIAGVTGTYEGSGSSDLITVRATNHKTGTIQAGQKVLVSVGEVSGVAYYDLYDATEISAPDYIKNYTFGIAVDTIQQSQNGNVIIPANIGTAVGRYVLNRSGQGHAYFNSYNTNDADFGSNYLGYAAINSDGYAQIRLPNVPYTDISNSLIKFAFKRVGGASEAKHLVAKVTNSWDTSKLKTEETEDVFRIYLSCNPSGYELEIQYKKTDGTFGSIAPAVYYMTANGDTLRVSLQLNSSQGLTVYVNENQIGTGSYTDLTTTENLRNYNIWNPCVEGNYNTEYLIAYEKDGYDELGCCCEFSNYADKYFLGGKYYY